MKLSAAVFAAGLANASAAQPQGNVPEASPRYELVTRASPPWPAASALRPVRAPDWADHRVYPHEARLREYEGAVAIEVLVAADGVPRACRVRASSGHRALDDGTCDLALQMRFARSELRGQEAVYRVRVTWALADGTPLRPGRMIATLDLADGRVVGCTVNAVGVVPPEWVRLGCSIITADLRHFLAGRVESVRRAFVTVELRPEAEPPVSSSLPRGEVVAVRRISFLLAEADEVRDCRPVENRGFGPFGRSYGFDCGHFLTDIWLTRDPALASPERGEFEIRVIIPPDG